MPYPGETGFGGASAKYQSTVGYDLATGLGSVNVTNLLNKWSSVAFTATTSTLVLSPTTFTHGSTANVTIHVAPSSGSGVPTGDVSLLTGVNTSLQGVAGFDAKRWGSLQHDGGFARRHLRRSRPLRGRRDFRGQRFRSHYDHGFIGRKQRPLCLHSVSTAWATSYPSPHEPYGNPLYLRADVAGLSGHGLASGSVAFFDNGGFINRHYVQPEQ